MANSMALNHKEKKIVGLAALGGMLEFYDFIIYGVFSVYFAGQFFPSENHLLSVIESYVIFILGYIARPIGGIIFSHVGDEHGRKKVLIITIVLMGASSLGIGILPTYNQIGVVSPILLLLLRLLQGFALGGELPSTYVYISESMPGKRGSGFGITMIGVNSGLLLGMLVNQILNSTISQRGLVEYGWRLPFIFGGALCLISYKIRKTLQETAEFNKIQDKPEFPLTYLFKHHFSEFIAGTATTAIMSSLVVAAIIFMPTYLHEIVKLSNHQISYIMPIEMIFNVTAIYLTGRIANQTSSYKILRTLLLISIPAIPLGYILIIHNLPILGLIILGILEGIAAMVIPLLVSLLFPAKIRLTGVALCYNVGFTIFGGLAPVIITSSIKWGYGIFLTPISYFALVIIICGVGLIYAKNHSYENIQ